MAVIGVIIIGIITSLRRRLRVFGIISDYLGAPLRVGLSAVRPKAELTEGNP